MSWVMRIHAVFGLLLWIMTVALFRQRVLLRDTPEGECAHVCAQLSRLIYLLLYVLFGAELLVRVGVTVRALAVLHRQRLRRAIGSVWPLGENI